MNIVEVKDFSFSYPDQRKEALEHASMEIQEGTLNVICGRSGCGKSTLLRQLKSVLAPHGASTGSILFKGTPLNKVDHRTQSSEIGYVMQNPDNQIVTDKVWHELAFGLESLGFETEDIRLRVAEMASYFGIHQWFYNIIGNNQYASAWIDESITTYLTNPGLDQYTGIITQPYNEFENDSDYSTAMYFYGASFYNKLEEKYGTSKINSFMNELLENYAYKEISTPELVKLIQKYYGTNNSIIKKYIEVEK